MESSLVNKKSAKNSNVEYCEPSEIHNSRKKVIEVLPYFIKHTDPMGERELAIKITEYQKVNSFLNEKATINFDYKAVSKLHEQLHKLDEIRKIPDTGNILLIKLGDGQKVDLSGLDASDVAKAIVSTLEHDDIIANIDSIDFSDNLAFAFRHSIRIKTLVRAMSELESALSETDNEKYYQDWCERNGWIFGNQYVMKDDVRRISRSDSVDFLVTSVITGFRDIIELKKPSTNVLLYDKNHDSYYFSAEVSKAVGQCHRYLDVLSEEAAEGLRDNKEIIAYHPRATIVIGRSNDWEETQHKALHGLNSRFNGVSVLTYDHLLLQGLRLIEILNNYHEENDESIDFDMADDSLPF